MKKKSIILIIFTFIIVSCASITDNGQVKVFFIETGKLQYFFPPRSWDIEKEGFQFNGDWLFRTFALPGEEESRTVFNFSLFYDKLELGSSKVSAVFLAVDDIRIGCRDIEVLFKNHNEDRYTCWISSSDYSGYMMSDGEQKIIAVIDGVSYTLSPNDGVLTHIKYFKQVQPEI